MYDKASQAYHPAVLLLFQHGIKMVEYGQQTMEKHGYPQVTEYFEYVIRDSEIQTASDLLKNHGYHFVHDLTFGGTIQTQGRYHATAKQGERRTKPIQLLPSSLVHVPVKGSKSNLECEDSDLVVYTLDLPDHSISLIRTIMDYPPKSHDRLKPLIELWALIAYDIFEYEWYDKEWYAPEESEEEFQRKVEFSIQKVQSWGLAKEYDTEQRLLEGLVRGTIRDDDIPCTRDVDTLCTGDTDTSSTKNGDILVTKDVDTLCTKGGDAISTKDDDIPSTKDDETPHAGDADITSTKDDEIPFRKDVGTTGTGDTDILLAIDADALGTGDIDIPCTKDDDIALDKDVEIPRPRNTPLIEV